MSEWVDIPLATQLAEENAGSSSYVSDAELVNLQLKENPPGSRAPFHIASVPTLSTTGVGALPGSGRIRGICVQRADAITGEPLVWLIRGTGAYYTSDLSTWSASVGTVPNANAYCRIIDAGNYVVSVDSINTRAISTAGSFAASIEGMVDVAYQDGYTIYADAGSDSVYVSSLDDPTTVGALDFTTVDALPGNIVGIVSDHRELYVLKSGSIEHYFNGGGAGFPFVRGSPGLIEKGCWNSGSPLYGVQTIAKLENSVFWVGDDMRVYMMRGYDPVPISNPWVEKYIIAYTPDSAGPRLLGNAFVLGGVPYYMISGFSDGGTETALVCDIKNRLWHKRNSPIATDLRLMFTCAFPNAAYFNTDRVVVTAEDVSSGASTLYWLDPAGTNDSGAASQTNRVMTLPQFSPGGGARRVFMPELYIDMQKAGAAGTLTLSWSDDGGANYTGGVSGTATNPRARFQRLGAFFQRILRFTFAINSRLEITGVRARIEVGS